MHAYMHACMHMQALDSKDDVTEHWVPPSMAARILGASPQSREPGGSHGRASSKLPGITKAVRAGRAAWGVGTGSHARQQQELTALAGPSVHHVSDVEAGSGEGERERLLERPGASIKRA